MAAFEDYLPRKKPIDKLGEWHWVDPDFANDYPAVYSLLAAARMEGIWRVGASVTVFCDTGELKFVISDRQTDQSLFGTLDASKPFWSELEGYVRAHRDSWRAKKVDPPGRR